MAANKAWRSDSRLELALVRVQRALAAWRLRRRHREAIPERLWRWIVPAAQTHGISPVARALRVNYTTLKERSLAGAKGVGDPAGNPPSRFIEVPVVAPTALPISSPWVIELEDRQGAKLTLRLAQAESTTVLELAQGLWRRRS